jgi:hypothetical protein
MREQKNPNITVIIQSLENGSKLADDPGGIIGQLRYIKASQ